MNNNSADLYQPIYSTRLGAPPVVIKAIVVPQNDYLVGGIPQDSARVENYVLLSVLPRDLQERVKTAVQALISSM